MPNGWDSTEVEGTRARLAPRALGLMDALTLGKRDHLALRVACEPLPLGLQRFDTGRKCSNLALLLNDQSQQRISTQGNKVLRVIILDALDLCHTGCNPLINYK